MKYINVLLIGLLMLFAGCSTSNISEIKSKDFIDTQVSVKGEVKNSIKLGELSGYIIKDETGEIFVSSKEIPSEGENIKVKGIVKKTILGYYIEEN